MVGRIKAPKNCGNGSRESPLRGDSLPKSGHFWYFGGRIPTRLHRLTWNFAQPSGPRCPSIAQRLTRIGTTIRPCGAKNLIFGLPVMILSMMVCWVMRLQN